MTIRGFSENDRLLDRNISRRAEYIEHRKLRPFEKHRNPALLVPRAVHVIEMTLEAGLGHARKHWKRFGVDEIGQHQRCLVAFRSLKIDDDREHLRWLDGIFPHDISMLADDIG